MVWALDSLNRIEATPAILYHATDGGTRKKGGNRNCIMQKRGWAGTMSAGPEKGCPERPFSYRPLSFLRPRSLSVSPAVSHPRPAPTSLVRRPIGLSPCWLRRPICVGLPNSPG